LFSSDEFHARRYWDADAVVRNYLSFLEGRSAYSPEFWRIICTELWLRKFFDLPPVTSSCS
jgi:asparagine synthase (glutamine-hydrolysing)